MSKGIFSIMVVTVSIFMFNAAWPANTPAQIQCVSIASGGAAGDRGSYQASISDDGQFIAFRSNATNLGAGDTNDLSDTFLHDTQSGNTDRITQAIDSSTGPVASFAPSISDDGNIIAIQGYRTSAGSGHNYSRIYVIDRQAGTTTDILPVDVTAGSDPTDREARQEPDVSGNGRFVAFHAFVNMNSAPADRLPLQDDTNSSHDIYVYDLQDEITERVSRDSNGVEGNGDSFSASLSDDGNFVAFYSYANNLVVNDTNEAEDVFVKDRLTDGTTRVSVASDGTEGNDDSYTPTISGNGRFVVFRSLASNLVASDTNGSWDIFVHDRDTDGNGVFDESGKILTERVSISSSGSEANSHSYSPSISDDGRYIVFRSNASNLVAGDSNNRWDIFLHDRQAGVTIRVNTSALGEANNHSYAPVISDNGKFVVFESDATNLIAGDTNESKDIFLVNVNP